MMAEFIIQIIQKLRPREGWILALYLFTAAISLPWSVMSADWLPGNRGVLPISLLALVVGLWAGQGSGAVIKLAVAVLVGIPGIGLWLIGALPSPGALINVVLQSSVWLANGRGGEWPGWPVLRASLAAGAELARRLMAWGQVTAGGDTNDTLPLLWLVGVLTWLAILWAAWTIRRWRRPGLALMPLGLLLTQHLIFAPSVTGQFAVFLSAAIGLFVQTRFLAQVERWDREGIDYSSEIHTDTTLVALLFVVLIPVIAWLTPLPILYGPARAAWEAFREPREAVGTVARRMLGPIQRPQGSGLFVTTDLSELPQGRVLAGPPSLRDAVVMRVQTSDPPPILEGDAVPNRYWRIETLDTYTGRGWENGPVIERRVSATSSEAVMVNLPPRTRLRQRFTLVGGTPPAAVNEPVAIDHDYARIERGVDDLATIRLAATAYTVVSQLPLATEARLRDLTPPSLERYITLPRSVPSRVHDLARSLTANTTNAYDHAIAIQTYLRTYTYDLNVPAAPPGRDVTDYFLFDLRVGYCDYMSTAMVVMLRSLGIPARLATGYATGSYDTNSGEYVVTGQEAHSWPEVFFPGVGWVEFEPTPARPVVDRPLSDEPPLVSTDAPGPVTDFGAPGRFWGALLPWLLLGWVVGLAGWGIMLYNERRFNALPPAEQIRTLWRRLLERASRLGHPYQATQTPSEYATSLGADLAPRKVEVGGLTWRGTDSREPLQTLAARVAETLYAPHPPDAQAAQAAIAAWQRVRRVLWLLLKTKS